MFVAQEQAMPKALSMIGLVVSLTLLAIFGADLALGFPLGNPSSAMDIGFVVCSVLLAWMSYTTFREQSRL